LRTAAVDVPLEPFLFVRVDYSRELEEPQRRAGLTADPLPGLTAYGGIELRLWG